MKNHSPSDEILTQSSFKDLALALAKAPNEKKALEIIESHPLMKDPNNWRPYNQEERNWDRIGAQAADPIPAMAEKVTNCIDAVLMRACWEKNIVPSSEKAPKTMREAVSRFFNVSEGNIGNLARSQRTALAENIQIIVTGTKRMPCYEIIDQGEGQPPHRFGSTFVSLGRDNKEKIAFVQGKYNMGGSAALSYCGEKMSQLIISRRAPALRKIKEDELWGFTFVRLRDPKGTEVLPIIEYFAPQKKIAAFNADSMPLLPTTKDELYSTCLRFGTYIKLYDYDMGPGARSVELGLNNALSQCMFSCCLPVRLRDTRVEREGTWERTFSGTDVRLDDPEDEEGRYLYNEGYSFNLNLPGIGNLVVNALPFKAHVNWLGKIGVMYVRNGQVHHTEDQYFFTDINFAALRGRMLVVVDCTNMAKQLPHLVFSTARDRMKKKHPAAKKIMAELKDAIKNHSGIKELNRLFHEENIKNIATDTQEIEEILGKMMDSDPTLAQLFGLGGALMKKLRTMHGGKKGRFEGKRFPTILNLEKGIKDGEITIYPGGIREITAITDANNDYLSRIREKGKVVVSPEMISCVCSLSDGLAKFKIIAPESLCVGEELQGSIGFSDVMDFQRSMRLALNFKLKIIEKPATNPLPPDNPEKSKTPKEECEQEPPRFAARPNLNLPKYVKVEKDDEQYTRFQMTEDDGFAIEPDPDGHIVVYVNMANKHYIDFILRNRSLRQDPIIEKQYIVSLLIFAVSLWQRAKKNLSESENIVRQASASYAQISLFIVRILGRQSMVVENPTGAIGAEED
ncbi:MAG: hypothetical protein BWY42_00335 [Candidatus Omnitrophica bacterium ADurb.Bin277]|nr:MAG: hypothetical protein BWY42_00335 [Candidatus Omnitrophica bacterium ADurb.Bin277]